MLSKHLCKGWRVKVRASSPAVESQMLSKHLRKMRTECETKGWTRRNEDERFNVNKKTNKYMTKTTLLCNMEGRVGPRYWAHPLWNLQLHHNLAVWRLSTPTSARVENLPRTSAPGVSKICVSQMLPENLLPKSLSSVWATFLSAAGADFQIRADFQTAFGWDGWY